MATLAENAAAVKAAQVAIDAAIVAKGGTTTGGLSNAATAIEAIPSGGGTSYPVPWKNDGKTHVWIRITPEMIPRNEFNFGRWVFHRETQGNVTIDFGDGSDPYTFAVGNATQIRDVRHVYAEPGDYEVVIDGYDAITNFGTIYLFEYATNYNSSTRNTYRSSQSVVQIEFAKVKVSQFPSSREMKNFIAVRFDGDCEITGLTNLYVGNLMVLECASNTLTTLANRFLDGCYNLSKVVFPASLTDYGQQTFYRCHALSVDMVLNEGTTIVRPYVFASCYLHSVDIPSTVTSIGSQAFLNVTTMAHVIVRATIPPTLENVNVFQGHAGNFYVPYGCSAAYKEAVNWQTFASRILELDESGNIPA